MERAGRPPGAGRTPGQTGSLVLPGARQETALVLVQLRRFHCGSQWKIHHEIVEVLDPASRDSFLDRTRIRHADGKKPSPRRAKLPSHAPFPIPPSPPALLFAEPPPDAGRRESAAAFSFRRLSAVCNMPQQCRVPSQVIPLEVGSLLGEATTFVAMFFIGAQAESAPRHPLA